MMTLPPVRANATEAAPLYSIKRVSKAFGGVTVLNSVDCDLYAGEVHCILGENGAGKSTLIKIMSGAHTPDDGTLGLSGQQIEAMTPWRAKQLGIATIYQELDLIPNMNAVDNICLGAEPGHRMGLVDRKKMRSIASESMRAIGIDLPFHVPVRDLGIAQQQMIAIAKALLADNKVLILDEPTAVFTKSETDVLFRLVNELKARGLAVVLISHHLSEVFEIGDRITIMRDGRVIDSGPIGRFDRDEVVRKMVGRDVDLGRRSEPAVRGKRVIEVRDLCFGDRIRNVSFHVDAGEIVGIAGLVGSGRTRVARMIYGDERPTSGTIVFNGASLRNHTPAESVARGMGMVPEDRKRDGLALERPAGENLTYGFIGKVRRLGRVPWKRVRDGAVHQYRTLGVRPANPSQIALRLSGGNQQKLVLGRWLLCESSLLILDEPTRGVDVGARQEIYAILRELKRRGHAILMISSDLPEILSQADRILVMSRGRITGELDGGTATEQSVGALAFRTDEAA